jgi:hypothetical protein
VSVLFVSVAASSNFDVVSAQAQPQPAQAKPPEAQPPEATQPNSAPPGVETDADDDGLSINFETDFNSRYVFRGIPSSAGPVVQSGLYFSKHGSTLGFWANLNGSRRGGENRQPRQANELDVTYVHSIERGRTTIEPAAMVYLYPTNISPTTGEISLRLARRVGKFRVFTSHTVDVLKYEGAYYGEIGVGREYEWSPHLSGEVNISLGAANRKFNEVNIGPHKSAVNVAALDLSLTRVVNEHFYVRPHLGYTRILDHELREASGEPAIWNLGLALGSDF